MSEYIGPGTFLGGRYEIIEKIGSGGMAIVYRAHCRLLNRYVAVKVLRPEFKEDAEFVKKFDIEAQAAASLSHPNIVSIYDVGREGDWHYIVMELVEGITLKRYIEEQGKLSWQKAANFAAQVCSALECAHKHHIIHHDIKPHNIIITPDGMAKVTDFGIARAATSSTLVAGSNTMGSVHYFSPEQARGGYTDEKSDIYSVGIVMYEMLTGKVPFNSDSPVTVALMHMQNDPVPPRQINSLVPKSIENIVLKAISKEQHLRYQIASEMLADLNAVLSYRKPKYAGADLECETKEIPALPEEQRNHSAPAGVAAPNKKAKKKKEPMKKNEKIAMYLAITVAAIIFGIIGWFTLTSMGIIPVSRNEAQVPPVVGMEINEAMESVKDMQFTIEVDEEVPSATVGKGHIVSQEPSAGRMVKVPSTIRVKVSSGVGTVEVPSVVNLEQRSAISELESLGLIPVVTEEASETIPAGVVMRQVPDAGVEVSANSVVRLYVSGGMGADRIKVPSLTGETLSRAKVLIESAGLVLGAVSEADSDKAAGTVIKQNPDSGSFVPQKTPIDLMVSKGEQTPTPPPATAAPSHPPAATEVPLKVKTLSIAVPQDKETTAIKIVANGKTIHDEVHHKSEGAFDRKVAGRNQVKLEIYHDGVLKSTQIITFD